MTSLLSLALMGSAAAQAPEPYATAVRLVDHLFLEPTTVEPRAMLREAASELSNEVPWLFVRDEGDEGVVLLHGGGAALGRVRADTWDQLPAQLHELERLVRVSGYPLPDDVEPRLVVLDGMTRALDRYSRVLSGDGLSRFDTRLKGTTVGIGVSLAWHGAALNVTRVDPVGPAQAAGVRVGDRVLRIDGRSTTSMPLADAIERVQGPANTPVVLTISRQERRGGAETTDTLDVALTRAEVVVPNVQHRVLDDGVGYVWIEHVSQQTVANLLDALASLRAQGALAKGLVVDLRGNTGGSMKEAARAADVFLTEGLLLRTVGHDGGVVQNLEAEMRATASGDEITGPVVVVVDDRTASGAEILAGALLEHDRTALVGARTYGKGTVQKIYTLEDDVRLKLTVARYLLENDRPISSSGIVPDVVVASSTFDDHGLRLDPGTARAIAPAGALGFITHVVDAQHSADVDVPLELARRAVLRARSAGRAELLSALTAEMAPMQAEQEARLTQALAARRVDWSPAVDEGTFPEVDLVLNPMPPASDAAVVEIRVTNRGPEPLHRAIVELESDTLSAWDGRAAALGRIEPGATASAFVRAPLRPGTPPREDVVRATLHSHRRPPLSVPGALVPAAAAATPELALSVRVVPHGDRTGPHGHPVQRAEISLTNHGPGPLHGLEVVLGYPDDERIELLDRGARLPLLSPGATQRVDLALEVSPTITGDLPLEVQVEADRFGRLLTWSTPTPIDGSPSTWRAPRIDVQRPSRPGAPGPTVVPVRVRDDGELEHVELWLNYRKVSWFQGRGVDMRVEPSLTLEPGHNLLTVVARDRSGLVTHRVVQLRTEEPSAADAE